MSAVEVRPLRQDDPAEAAAAEQVVREAFGEEGEAVVGVLADLRAAGALRAVLVAVDGAAVVGVVALSAAWVDARERLADVLVLSPLAVAPGHQGRGTGTALLAAVDDAARGLGAPVVVLEGSPDYYGARGWVPAEDAGVLRPSERIPRRAFQCRVLAPEGEHPRGRLVYPDPWWRRDLVGLRDPLLAELEARLG